MYLNAGASQRAQGRSPGLGGVALIGVESLQAPWASLPAGRRRPEAGRSHRTASNTYQLGAEAGLYILSGMSGRLRRRVRMGIG